MCTHRITLTRPDGRARDTRAHAAALFARRAAAAPHGDRVRSPHGASPPRRGARLRRGRGGPVPLRTTGVRDPAPRAPRPLAGPLLIGRLVADEAARPKLLQRLLDLRARVHHERAVARDRLVQRPRRRQQESPALAAPAAASTTSPSPKTTSAGARTSTALGPKRPHRDPRRRTPCGRAAPSRETRRPAGASRRRTSARRRDPPPGPTSSPPAASPAITRTSRPVAARRLDETVAGEIAILRPRHLLARRQVEPELQARDALGAHLRHLLVHDAAARRHPLDVAGADGALVAERVAVAHFALPDQRHGLDAAVRVIGEPGLVVAPDRPTRSDRAAGTGRGDRAPACRCFGARWTPAPSTTGSGGGRPGLTLRDSDMFKASQSVGLARTPSV